MILKIIQISLMIIAVGLCIKHGINMILAKPAMLEMFGKWQFNKTAVILTGCVTLLSALLIPFHKTFLWGNFLMAAGILLIISLQLLHKDLKGAMIEIPFLLLNLIILYLQYPFPPKN